MSPADVACANANNVQTPCRNGYCQLSSSDIGGVTQTCINRVADLNSWGVSIQSRLNGKQNEDATFTYTCNRAMCNSIATAYGVEQLLIKYKLVTKNNIGLETTTTTTTATTTTVFANETQSISPKPATGKPSAAGRMAYSNPFGIELAVILSLLSLFNL